MRHVDDGTLNAWLDGQIADPAEIAGLEEHLRECAVCTARFAEERATRDRAAALLGVVAPGTADRPPFEELVARAGSRRSAAGGAAGRARAWWVPASWAASVLLALGLGWAAHDLARQQAPEPAELRALRVGPPAHDAIVEAPAHDAIMESSADAVVAERDAPRPATPTQAASAPPPAATPPETPAARDAGPVVGRDMRPVAGTEAQPPAADALSPAADASRAAAAPPRPPLLEQRAEPQARAEAFALEAVVAGADTVGWRTVARTEAAAYTGMALYGIDGLDPAFTALSADGMAVRTLYVLEAGDTVELVQRRVDMEPATPAPLAETARLAPQVRRQARAPAMAAIPSAEGQTLTVTQGGVVVTLKAGSLDRELESLAGRLRVD